MSAKILVVEDDRIDRMIAVQALGKHFDVDQAADGLEGLEKATEGSYDLIMLDVEMPEMNGGEMLRALRDKGVETPVILLTGEVRTSVIGELMSYGISNYIVKPVPPHELVAKATLMLKETLNANDSDETKTELKALAELGLQVLLVDDMEQVEESLQEHLPGGVMLRAARTKDAAAEQIHLEPWDFVLVDMEMPQVDTVELALSLKSQCASARVIGLFLRDASYAKDDARRYGLDGHIYKPFDERDIRVLLSDHRRQGQRLVAVEGNVMSFAEFPEDSEEHQDHLSRVLVIAQEHCRLVAAGCYSEVILSLSSNPPQECLSKLIQALKIYCEGLGLRLGADEEVSPEVLGVLKELGLVSSGDDKEIEAEAKVEEEPKVEDG
ncbi:MAG: response regulator [Deltaproteobacteria bacterium]|jgi:DNA-binding response OmpR family regulator|nr:response regulator [Deltaproteobacteria bacterium]MBT6434845.1 response regulator [Deltaproteobacteria bacterium]